MALRGGRQFLNRLFKPGSGSRHAETKQPTNELHVDPFPAELQGSTTARSAHPPADLAAGVGSVNGIQGAHGVQLQNSNINVVGRDVHNITYNHYHELKDELKALFKAIANYRKIQQDTLAKATPGTVRWFFKWKEFRVFIDIDGNLRILWGSGMPGAGKSIFASIVIDWLEALARDSSGHICVAYAYIRYSDQDQVTVRGILESLVRQTIERHPDCEADVRELFSAHIREGTRPTEDELFSLLGQFCQKKKITFYILDALDEAPSKVRLKLLQKLSSTGARIFVTSRPLPQLEAEFPSAHLFPIVADGRDLDLHITEKIRESQDLRDLLKRSDAGFRERLTQTVKDKCGGMFLHASLQLDALQECFTEHDAIRTLEQFPPKIEDVYRQTWNRILKSDSPHHSPLAKAAFAWVLNAKQSLTIGQLRHAIATCPDTYHFEPARLVPEATILAVCRGLITVDKESKLVRLVHYTAQKPLESLLLNSIPHPHSLLAAVCVTLLTDCGFQNTTFIKSSELRSVLDAEPFLAYAYAAWAFHTNSSLNADLTARIVPVFVSGCRAFPLSGGASSYWDVDPGTPLHIAARYGLPIAFSGPYQAGASNARSANTKFRRTPLHLSCLWGHLATTQSLLSLPDILVNLKDMYWLTALMFASMEGHEGIVKLLLAHPDIQVNQGDIDDETALMCAARGGYEGIVKLFLACPDIQVNLGDSAGKTALMCASVRGGHEGVCKLLLAHPDIQVNSVDRDGNTALMHASEGGCEGIVRLLLAHPDTQVNLANSNGYTALMLASKESHRAATSLLAAYPGINLSNPHSS